VYQVMGLDPKNEVDVLKANRASKEALLKKIIALPASVVSIKDVPQFNEIIQNYKGIVLIIDFWSTTCAPCKLFSPVYEDAQKRWGTEYIFSNVNIDEVPGVAKALSVEGVPTLMFVKDGVELYRNTGALRKSQFDTLLQAIKTRLEQQSKNDSQLYS
jgi:thioredoxin 1